MPLTKPSREFLWPPLIMATVFLASGQTTLATPSFSFSPDKIAHFAVFGALATSVIRLSFLRDRGWRAALGVWLLVAGYGGLDEYR
ncbi:MAG: VanZ family protein, partial [Kiritimatiellia bacterium]